MKTLMIICAIIDTVLGLKAFGMGHYGWGIYMGCLTVFALLIASNYKGENDETDPT